MELSYRKAKLEDFLDFYKLKCEDKNIAWTGYDKKPNKESLQTWYAKNLESENRTIYLVWLNRESCVAYFYVDIVCIGKYELGYGVSEIYNNQGIGTYCISSIKEIIQHFGGGEVSAFISENNRASMRCIQKNGFIRTDEFDMRELKAFLRTDKFYKWIIDV